jgi:mannose-6-phosphate isomerase-like protein (cupin superfamily)
MTTQPATRHLVLPGGGERIWDGPIDTTVIVPTEATHGALSITEMAVTPGYMVPPHVHHATDEWSYVLFGRIGARIGDDEFTAEPGSWILKPRGILHTFWNAGPAPARIIELLTPGAFEHMFRGMADLAARNELTDERLDALAQEHQTDIDMSWVDDLSARYGLEVTL